MSNPIRNRADIAQRRAELLRQLNHQETILQQDIQTIQDRWSSLTSIFSIGSRVVQYIAPKTNYLLLGVQLMQRIFRRRKK